MAAVSLAILGKNDDPLYLKEFSIPSREQESSIDEEELFGLPKPTTEGKASTIPCSLRQQFILHAALDRFEQLSGPPPGHAWRKQGVTGTEAMFVGLLAPVENMRVYGYMTTTEIRFLLTVEDQANVAGEQQRVIDESIKKLLIQIHRLYVEYTLNSFSNLNGPIRSHRFDKSVVECVEIFNRSK